jgi:hypothetical protein
MVRPSLEALAKMADDKKNGGGIFPCVALA